MMWLRLIPAPVWIFAALALAFTGMFYVGKAWERSDRAAQDAQDYIEGVKDDKNSQENLPADDDARREWLRAFGD